MNGRAFDAQVVQTDVKSKRGKLLKQYVCARVTKLNGIDVNLFEFDRHNALYFFILNSDEEIYLRYGGRDSESATSYLNLRSLELALEKGLELHADKNWKPTESRKDSLFPIDIPLLGERTKRRFLCVECHLVGDYQTINLERKGTLDRVRDLYVSPDIKKIGLVLDVPKGLVIKQAECAAKDAKLKPGDTVTHLNDQPVYTFGDLQYRYGKVNRKAKSIKLGVNRAGKRVDLILQLPNLWWLSDLSYRRWTVEPVLPFRTKPLELKEKQKRSLPTNSFASKVTSIEFPDEAGSPPLKVDDVILQVNDNDQDEIAHNVELHIKLRYSSGEKLKLLVERNGNRFASTIQTVRQNFRKPEIAAVKRIAKTGTPQGEVEFEAKRVGDFLVVWATHANGWHTYAMDNEIRAKEAAGKTRLLGVEKGLSISVTGGIKTVSEWRQSKPKEFSDLGKKWFSFGFDKRACFACKIQSIGTQDVLINISGQTCDSSSCRPVDIYLRIPNVKSSDEKFEFEQLVYVKQQAGK